MIARNITKSKKIAQLSDSQRVMYAFILPFLDRDGRINAHPTYLKGQVFLSLEYTEAQIEAAVRKFHDVGLATVYPTEDAVVMEYASFAEFNKPNHRETESEYPAPSDELRNRPETRPSTTRSNTPPVIARELPGSCPVNSGAEVEVEVELEVEVEVEGQKKSASAIPEPGQTQRQQTTTAGGESRLQSLNLIKAKLGTRHSNRSENDPPIDLLTECFSEDPSRDKWLDIPPARVRTLIQKASQEKKKTRFGTFKGFLIDLLDAEAQTDMVKTTTAAPPVAGGPPARCGLSEELLRESLGEEIYAEMYGS